MEKIKSKFNASYLKEGFKKLFTLHSSLFTLSVSKQKGFTLLEVILVLAILATISAIGFSYLGGFKSGADLEETAGQIVGKLREAQNKAMAGEDNQKWGAHFDNTGADPFYEIFSTNTDYAGASAVVEKIYLTSLAADVKFDMPAGGQSVDVIFSKITGVPPSAQDIVINLQGATKTISIETGGRIRIQ